MLGPITLLVTDRIDHAFDAIYPTTGGGCDAYPHGILVLEDRSGKQYLWAQSPPKNDPKTDAKPKRHFSGLRPGQFITTTYRLRTNWLGEDWRWQVAKPGGTHITYANSRQAKLTDRWPTLIKVNKPDQSELDKILDEMIEEEQRNAQS